MSLDVIIAQEIQDSVNHRISFSRFMELSLYHPIYGYYMKDYPKLGRVGDFFTNAHVGNVYGRVLSNYFSTLLSDNEDSWALVEMGAGDGRLAQQVCEGLLELGVDPKKVHVYLIETSPYHRRLQQELLQGSPCPIQWVTQLREVPEYPFSIIYSNELVDSFPVHRVKRVNEENIAEVYVTFDEQKKFIETFAPASVEVQHFLKQFNYQLEIGQYAEVNLQAKSWIDGISQWMKSGYVLTIDYGAVTRELLLRQHGTLRFYHQHTMPLTPYEKVGDIDITCHVNFEALKMWGEEADLKSVSFSTQSQFLIQSGILDILSGKNDGDPFSVEAKKRRTVQQLIHPEAMGEAFHVLLQRKEQTS